MSLGKSGLMGYYYLIIFKQILNKLIFFVSVYWIQRIVLPIEYVKI